MNTIIRRFTSMFPTIMAVLILTAGALFAQVPDSSAPPSPPRLLSQEKFKPVLDALTARGDTLSPAGIAAVSIGSDTSYVILYRLAPDGSMVPDRRPWSPDLERAAFPPTPSASPAPSMETVALPSADSLSRMQEGRTWFIVSTAVRSLYVYSLNLGLAFPSLRGQTLAGISLLSLGGSTAASYLFTRDMQLGHGRVALMNYGSELGIAYPLLFDLMLTETRDDDYYYEDYNPDYSGRAWGTMVGFPTGIYLASRYPLKDPHNYGHVAACRHFSRSAWLYGFLLPLFYDFKDIDNQLRLSAILTMGLFPTGYYLGERLLKDQEISPGRGHMVEVAGSFGTLSGAMLFSTLAEKYGFNDNGIAFARWIASSALIGHALGTWYGLKYDSPFKPTMGQAVFMDIAGISGVAAGLGLSLIADLDFTNGTVLTFLSGWGGYLIGERISRNVLDKTDRDLRASSLKIDSPLLSQLPVLALTSMLETGNDKARRNPQAVDFVRVRF